MACHIISKRPPLEMFWLVCLYYFIVNVHGNTSENAIGNVLLIQFILFPRDTVGNVLVSLFILFYCECSWKYFRKCHWKCFIDSVYTISKGYRWKCFVRGDRNIYVYFISPFKLSK